MILYKGEVCLSREEGGLKDRRSVLYFLSPNSNYLNLEDCLWIKIGKILCAVEVWLLALIVFKLHHSDLSSDKTICVHICSEHFPSIPSFYQQLWDLGFLVCASCVFTRRFFHMLLEVFFGWSCKLWVRYISLLTPFVVSWDAKLKYETVLGWTAWWWEW